MANLGTRWEYNPRGTRYIIFDEPEDDFVVRTGVIKELCGIDGTFAKDLPRTNQAREIGVTPVIEITNAESDMCGLVKQGPIDPIDKTHY